MPDHNKKEEIHYFSSEELKKLQIIGLEMLIEVDRICRKHGINYQLDGGVLLGAARDGKFIPWDDDVDIRMLRKDYNRFCKVCETELDKERFFLQNYFTDPGYRWEYAKLLRNGTGFYRINQEMLTQRKNIYLDIFPCDNMPEKGLNKLLFNVECFWYRKIAYSPIGAVHEKNLLKKCVYRVLRHIPKEYFVNGFEALSQRISDGRTKLVRILGWGGDLEWKGYLYNWLKYSQDMSFEGRMFLVPVDYDGYLRYHIGNDYMKLPPKEKQIGDNFVTSVEFGDAVGI